MTGSTRLEGWVAAVTGGASGIGAECARRFVVEGARVVLGDRNADLLSAMAMELAPQGIRVVAIGPGYVETPLTSFAQAIPAIHDAYVGSIPMGRAGQPRDIADAAVFLASDEAAWITGTTLYVDGAEATKGYPELAKLARG